MPEKRFVTVTLHFFEEEHKALSEMKAKRCQTWENFVIGMARETGEYSGPDLNQQVGE